MKKLFIYIFTIMFSISITVITKPIWGSTGTERVDLDYVLKEYNENLDVDIIANKMIEYSTEDLPSEYVKWVALDLEYCLELKNHAGEKLTEKTFVNKQLLNSFIDYRDKNCRK